ncbi:MAG: hypothetical protein ABIJ58_00420, partial [Nanoarchaeota archaeon]
MIVFLIHNNNFHSSYFKNYTDQSNKIIIKIGTSVIFDSDRNRIRKGFIPKLARDVSKLRSNGKEIIIVSSGAVGCGKSMIKGNEEIRTKQAQASIGQILLLEKYNKHFKKFNLGIAQFLLTSRELREKESLENIKSTYNQVKNHAVAIVNENDVISVKELSFGDNDNLAKELMLALDFDTLIILTKKGQLIKNGKKLTKTN